MAGRNDRCETCEHFRDAHDENGCRKPGCDCQGFARRVSHYSLSGTKAGGTRRRAGDTTLKG